jgi:hypothetical protein
MDLLTSTPEAASQEIVFEASPKPAQVPFVNHASEHRGLIQKPVPMFC